MTTVPLRRTSTAIGETTKMVSAIPAKSSGSATRISTCSPITTITCCASNLKTSTEIKGKIIPTSI